MTTLTDAFVPPREEMTRIQGIRNGEPHQPGTPVRGSDAEHTPDLRPTRGTHELHEQAQQNPTEPHGMYWHRNPDGSLVLRPHAWFIKYVASGADQIFMLTREAVNGDQEATDKIAHMASALHDYIDARADINPMVVQRKFRQELDDAAYQLCQAAKYKIDAEERAKFLVDRDDDILDNEQISSLIERAQQSAHEGYIVAMAVRQAGFDEPLVFEPSAKRVIDYSCRRLTEWFAQRRRNDEDRKKVTIEATMSVVANMFTQRRR